ncbi:MAG: asparagine synthase-related protein [Algoriphagus sp.]|nr:asparagine synthase-related protein [Algoriphagus sp.]
MKGFFGIINLDNEPVLNSKELFLSNYPAVRNFLKLDSDRIFIIGMHPDFPIRRLEKFPDLTFAGWCRLDNLDLLQSELGLSNTSEESEVILHAFHTWGEDCVRHFIGDFSFVIWNQKNESLFLTKDQLGIRPLFYLTYKNLFFFATNITLIKKAVPEKLPLNEIFIAKELKYYPQEIEMTFFKDIHRLRPAHYLHFFHGNPIEENRYWDLEKIDLSFCKKDEDYLTLLRETLTESVKCRARGKKTIGSQLSGGMDSSAITVLLSRLIDKKELHTYSFVLDDFTKGFSDTGIDEKDTQEEIIKYAGLIRENHHQVRRFHYKDVFEELQKRNEVMGGLGADDAYWQDTLFKMAAEDQKAEVVFSGFPGDEGISEYGSQFFNEYIFEKNIPRLIQYVFEFRRGGLSRIRNYFRAKKAGMTVLDYPQIQEKRNLLKPDSELNHLITDTSFKFNPTYKGWLKHRICMADTSLRLESEASYANQYDLETVYPLADIRLLEIVYSLPVHLFKPKPYNRAVFRNVCKGILPDKVRLQKKYNGAYTLAFYDYLEKIKFEELKNYQAKNHTGMLINEDDFLKKTSESEKQERLIFRKEVDYIIDLNWPVGNEN